MTVTVQEIAAWVKGEVVGDPTLPIRAARTLHEAQPGDISFLEDFRNHARLTGCQATALVVSPQCPEQSVTLIRVADPLMAFVTIVQRFQPPCLPDPPAIHPTAFVDDTAVVGEDVRIDAHVVIGPGSKIGPRSHLHTGVVIGRECILGADNILYPQVIVYDRCRLGDRVILHAHAVVGADGFGYRLQEGRHVKVPQLGWVEIGDDVEVGAGTTIDRGTFGPTSIGQGTKIDNLVQIGHNNVIGRHNLIVSQVGIAGSCVTGDYVILAGQVGVADHSHIGEGAIVGAQGGVVGDIPAGQRVWGTPAAPEFQHKRILVLSRQLPELKKQLHRIAKQLDLERHDPNREAS